MLEKNNNLVATAISETFNNSDNNYLLGDWCRKVSDFSKNQYSIKFKRTGFKMKKEEISIQVCAARL